MHEAYIQRCLQLAALGRGHVAPNPLVGAVIVHNNRIIGEGWHRKFGEAHAEVHAIASVQDKALLKESTLYVNLEPCAHFGKTPPCASLIIEKQIPRVVLCNADPFEQVAGKGIQMLRDAGTEVHTGILEAEGRLLNRHFFTYTEKKRPYITLKFARSADGFIDGTGSSPLAVTQPLTNVYTHRLRTEYAAVLAGFRTVLKDDPLLSVRLVSGASPLRVLADPELALPRKLRIFNDGLPVLLLNRKREGTEGSIRYVLLKEGLNTAEAFTEALYRMRINSVLVEGGAATLQQFLDAGLWDDCYEYIAPLYIREGVKAPRLPGGLAAEKVYENDTDTVLRYTNP